jgi:hypothetical protein
LQDEGPGDDIIECGEYGEVPRSVCEFYLSSRQNSQNTSPAPGTVSPGRREQLNRIFDTLQLQFNLMAEQLSDWFKSKEVSRDCLTSLGFVHITASQLAARLGEVSIHNGFENSTALSGLLRPGTAEYDVAVQRGFTVGDSFTQTSGTGAMASLNSPDIWLSPFRLKADNWASNAATLVHEALHTFNKTDEELQRALWGFGSEIGAASVNITDRIRTDCFSGYRGPK